VVAQANATAFPAPVMAFVGGRIVVGRFVDGVGTFLSDETFNGRPIVVRFVWSDLTERTAHWEQAFSTDRGTTWEVNWITDFTRSD
jgi:hypothetical protein